MHANASPVLQMKVERQPTKTVVHCAGKVNLDSWAQFSTTVRALIPEKKPIKVDLSNVVQVDSVGIGTFVSVWASAKKNDCDLKFINPNERVADVIRITRLYPLFESDDLGPSKGP